MYVYIYIYIYIESVRVVLKRGLGRGAEQPIGRGQFLCFAISGVLLEDVAPSG